MFITALAVTRIKCAQWHNTLGNMSSPKGLLTIGTGCPRKWSSTLEVLKRGVDVALGGVV